MAAKTQNRFGRAITVIFILIVGVISYILMQIPFVASIFLGNPSIAVPFNAHRAGEAANIELNISHYNIFSFYLVLSCVEAGESQRAYVQAIAGSGGRDQNGKNIDNGIKIPIRLIVSRIDGDNIDTIFDQKVYSEELEGYNREKFWKIITRLKLNRGKYSVRIESVVNIPELDNVNVEFDVHTPGNLK